MDKQQLRDIVEELRNTKYETNVVEAKSAHEGSPKRLYDTLSSFSNQDTGGTIVFGLDENAGFAVVGVKDVKALETSVRSQGKAMSPEVVPEFVEITMDGKSVVGAYIKPAPVKERPVFYKSAGIAEGSYVRVGDADERMSPREIYALMALSNNIHDDIRIAEGLVDPPLDERLLNEYLAIRKARGENLMKLLDNELIVSSSGVKKDGRLTVAGALVFSPYPQLTLPGFRIDACVVPGLRKGDTTSEGVRLRSAKKIEGNIPTMVHEAIRYVNENTPTDIIIDDAGKRYDRHAYPENALREALMNALIHRDYSIQSENAPVTLDIYYDRVEIKSPGPLFGATSVDRIFEDGIGTRNRYLVDILFDLGYVEHRFTGIPTIRSAMEKVGYVEPTFRNRGGNFTVILESRSPTVTDILPGSGKKSSMKQAILAYCRLPRSKPELILFTGLSRYLLIKDYLDPMLESGELGLTIPDKPGSKYQRYYRKKDAF